MSPSLAAPIQTDARTEVSNPEALAMLLDLLDDQATGVRRVFNVTIDDEGDVFRGNAEQPFPNGQVQTLAFKITSDQIAYRVVPNPRSDEFRGDRVSGSKRAGRKLNCRPGNVQCGGKCQGGSLNCFVNMTPQQKSLVLKAQKLARQQAKANVAQQSAALGNIQQKNAQSNSAAAARQQRIQQLAQAQAQRNAQKAAAAQAAAQAQAQAAAALKAKRQAAAQKAAATKAAKAAQTAQAVRQQLAAQQATASQSASLIKTNQVELSQKRSDLVQRFGAKTVSDAELNVQKVLDKADVFVRVGTSDTLEKILSDRFRTVAEIGTDTHSIPDLKGGYQVARKRVEAKILGYSTSTNPGDRPIYGYLGSSNLNGRSHADAADTYGSITLKMKADVKGRTTFTGQDSFKSGIASEVKNSGSPPPPNAASLTSSTRHGYDRDKLPSHYPSNLRGDQGDLAKLQAATKAKDIDELAPSLRTTGKSYVEAQIHGKVRPTDIAEIHFSPKKNDDQPTAAIAQFAKDNKVKLFVNGKEINPDDILKPPASAKLRTQQLNDAIDKRDFAEVLKLTDAISADIAKVTLTPGERDAALKQLFKDAGFDGKPKIGTAKDVTDAWKQGGTLAVRGLNPGKTRTELFDLFKNGDYFTGNGIYGNGTYVSAANGTTAKAANDALKAIRTHRYATARGVTFRFAIEKDAKLIKASDFAKEDKKIRKDFNDWVDQERARIAKSSGTKVASSTKLAKDFTKSLDVATATTSVSGTINSGVYSSYALFSQFSSVTRVDRITYSHKDSRFGQMQGATVFTNPNGSRYLLKEDGTVQSLKAKTTVAAQKEVAKILGEQYAASNGGGTSSLFSPALKQFDDRVKAAQEVLFGGTGNAPHPKDPTTVYSERLAVIRGYDGIKLNHSYEENNFLLLFNRTKVIVQDREIKYNSRKVATDGQ